MTECITIQGGLPAGFSGSKFTSLYPDPTSFRKFGFYEYKKKIEGKKNVVFTQKTSDETISQVSVEDNNDVNSEGGEENIVNKKDKSIQTDYDNSSDKPYVFDSVCSLM